ncbi:hypothetical protein GR294_04585 [Raoultella sp. Lac2]|uniref:hypothetical protein n=1 Tax=Klebsiella/Raoultella group TaxID=2890311 RepID=UPI00114F5CF7|nr:hypothetical protein [Klebsiella electrica]MXF45853.1 hypothetical protein [Raoultella sp. Lac2]MXG00366.1 hypothetical protein [Raoultella sp. Lac1]QDI10431.1 hypothetical protein electrica_04392 [Klebsiella electrica]WIO43782.1 hypothetical protein P2G42_03760 [Klebsiella electrica]
MSFNKISRGLLDMLLFAIVNIWDIFQSVIFVGGFIVCIMLPVVWPMKFFYMVVWFITAYAISKLVDRLDEYRKKGKNIN